MQTSFIGDVILTTPLIATLAARGAVDVVTTPIGASVLANHPDIRALIPYDKRHTDRGIAGFARTARRIRQRAAQESGTRRAYLCQGSTRSGALAFVSGYKERIGFGTSAGSWTYTQRTDYRDDWHHARRLLSLADYAVAQSITVLSSLQPRLYPSSQDSAAVDALLTGRTRPMIAIAPGSVWATKRWPYYAELCQLLVDDFDVAIVGATGDAALLGTTITDPRVIDATGKLSLLGSAALIGRALAIVTNDSSPQHLASAMGTPTVTVFGPTVPEFGFGPLARSSQVVGRTELACRPCDRHGPQRCPLGHWRCMREIRADEVRKRVITVIQQDATR